MRKAAVFTVLIGMAMMLVGSQVTFAYTIPDSMEVTIDINPDTLCLGSRGVYVTCYITPPEEYNAHDFDISSISMEGLSVIPDKIGFIDHDGDGFKELMVKFDRQALIVILLGTEGEVDLTITGSFQDGTEFYGIDTIVVAHARVHPQCPIQDSPF